MKVTFYDFSLQSCTKFSSFGPQFLSSYVKYDFLLGISKVELMLFYLSKTNHQCHPFIVVIIIFLEILNQLCGFRAKTIACYDYKVAILLWCYVRNGIQFEVPLSRAIHSFFVCKCVALLYYIVNLMSQQ